MGAHAKPCAALGAKRNGVHLGPKFRPQNMHAQGLRWDYIRHLGPMLRSFWAIWGPCWAHAKPFGPFGAKKDHLGPKFKLPRNSHVIVPKVVT